MGLARDTVSSPRRWGVTSQQGHRALVGDLGTLPFTNADGTSRTDTRTGWVGTGQNGGGRWNHHLTPRPGDPRGMGRVKSLWDHEGGSCFRFIFQVTVVAFTTGAVSGR